MVWYGVKNVNNMGTCGDLLVSVVHNFKPGKQGTIFAKQSAIANNFQNFRNADLIGNNFNYNTNFIPGEYKPIFDFSKMNGANTDLDLIGASFYNPFGGKVNNKPVNLNAKINTAPTATVKRTPKSTSYIGNLWRSVKKTIKEIPQKISNFFNGLVDFAMSFIGKINCDRDGNRLFSPNGRRQAWCADFVTYCVKKIFGNKIPSDFGSSAVSGLLSWGRKYHCYMEAPTSRTQANMKNYLAQKVKPGDIMIQKNNGSSHTGIVKSVAADGSSYTVIEGNSSNKVQTVTYKATDPKLSGFISLSQFA